MKIMGVYGHFTEIEDVVRDDHFGRFSHEETDQVPVGSSVGNDSSVGVGSSCPRH